MRRLCVFWHWVMEHAEDISTLPKTTIKLRDSVSHFPYRQIQLFSSAWKIIRVSSHNSSSTLSLAARTSLYEPLVAQFYRQGNEEQWLKLSWECTLYLPPLAWKQGQGGIGTHSFCSSLALTMDSPTWEMLLDFPGEEHAVMGWDFGWPLRSRETCSVCWCDPRYTFQGKDQQSLHHTLSSRRIPDCNSSDWCSYL